MTSQAITIGAATGVDPVADAVTSLGTLNAALVNINNALLSMAAPAPADVASIQAQVANISADLTQIQAKLAACQGSAVTPQTPQAPAEPQISAQAAAFVALGALAVGGVGAYLIWGRRGNSKDHRGSRENPAEMKPRRRRIRKTGRRYVSKEAP